MRVKFWLAIIATICLSKLVVGNVLRNAIIPAAKTEITNLRQYHNLEAFKEDTVLKTKAQEKCDSILTGASDALNSKEPEIVNSDTAYANGYSILVSRAQPAEPAKVQPYMHWIGNHKAYAQLAWPNSTHIGVSVADDGTNVVMCAAIAPAYDPNRANEIQVKYVPTGGDDLGTFKKGEEWLEELNRISTEEHNRLRKEYNGAEPLKTNAHYAQFCVKWSKKMCETGKFDHSDVAERPGPGESIVAGPYATNESAVRGAIETWYAEVSIYAKNCAADFYSIGHFLAIVGKPATMVGIGVYVNDKCKNHTAYVCANYGGGYSHEVPDRAKNYGGTCSAAPNAIAVLLLHIGIAFL